MKSFPKSYIYIFLVISFRLICGNNYKFRFVLYGLRTRICFSSENLLTEDTWVPINYRLLSSILDNRYLIKLHIPTNEYTGVHRLLIRIYHAIYLSRRRQLRLARDSRKVKRPWHDVCLMRNKKVRCQKWGEFLIQRKKKRLQRKIVKKRNDHVRRRRRMSESNLANYFYRRSLLQYISCIGTCKIVGIFHEFERIRGKDSHLTMLKLVCSELDLRAWIVG